jgi:tight adherence protein B
MISIALVVSLTAMVLLLGFGAQMLLQPPSRSRRRRTSSRRRHRRLRRSCTAEISHTIELLDRLASEVRSGASLRGALESACHPTDEASATEAIAQLARRVNAAVDATQPSRALTSHQAVATQAITAALTFGGAQGLALDNAATMLRERAAIESERAAHSTQARLSARVMTIVPVAFAGWTLSTNEPTRRAVGTSLGTASLVVGIILNAVGWLWIRRIVRTTR